MTALFVALALASVSRSAPPGHRAAARAVAPVVQTGPEVGVAVAVLCDGRETYLNFGKVETPVGVDTPTPDTLFEIGSITKVFTGILLAEAMARGEVKLGDGLQEHLPPGWAVPEFAPYRPVTLLSLATHTSGLPRVPASVLFARDSSNPYADLTAAKVRAQLALTKLTGVPGAKTVYSNLGAGLLGEALVHRAGVRSYHDLVRERIADPLGLADTAEALTGEQVSRFAAGRNGKGEPAPAFDLASLPGCGALRSTTRNLVTFARANLGEPHSPLTAVCQLSHRERLRGTGLFWGHLTVPGTPYRAVCHNGGTGGFSSMLLLVPERRFAVVVLANAGGVYADTGRAALKIAQAYLSSPKESAPPPP